MDYHLESRSQGAFLGGNMPAQMLVERFEETDIPNDDIEFAYDSYVRGEIMDRRPDKPAFAHEETRHNPGGSYGFLNLRYGGTRGTEDVAYVPERFMGFNDPDPRGTELDPRMHKMGEQARFRMRYERMKAEGGDQVGSGNRSEHREMRDIQAVRARQKATYKIFNRSLCNMDPKTTILHTRKAEQRYVDRGCRVGDGTAECTLDTVSRDQNLKVMMCKKIIRDTKVFRDETMDGEFATGLTAMQYKMGLNRSKRQNVGNNTMSDFRESERAGDAVGVLMAALVAKTKRHVGVDDTEHCDSDYTRGNPVERMERKLRVVLNNFKCDSKFKEQAETFTAATPTPQDSKPVIGKLNHDTDLVTVQLAAMAYKAVKEGNVAPQRNEKDIETFDSSVTTEHKNVKQPTVVYDFKKAVKDTEDTEGLETANYKNLRANNNGAAKKNMYADQAQFDSAKTQDRKYDNRLATQTSRDGESTVKLMNNTYMERHTGVFGSKYVSHKAERDMAVNDIAALA